MPTLKQRGKAWQLRWWGPDRDPKTGKPKEHTTSLGPIPAAEAKEILKLKREELRRAKLAGVVALPAGAAPTFQEFAADYIHWHASEYPSSSWRIAQIIDQYLIPHFGATALDRISKTQAERYKVTRTAKSETIAKELRTLQAMMNRAVFLELINRNPVKGIKPPKNTDSKPPRWYSEKEMKAIYAHSKVLSGDEVKKGKPVNSSIKDYAPVWRLLANTGMRRSEALALEWSGVTKAGIRILSTEANRTKSGHWRIVPLSAGALVALKELKKVTGKSSHVLPRIQPESLTRSFDRIVQRAGLDGSLHCLRHTFCAALVTAGVPLRTVQVLAGHANSATTEKYAHLAPDYLQDSVGRIKL